MFKNIYRKLPLSIKTLFWGVYCFANDKSLINVDKLFNHGPYQQVFKETKVIFIHIPKAAGTSLSYWIYGKKIGHISYNEFKSTYPNEIRKYKVITFVRNPVDRLFSAYNFLKQGGTKSVSVNKKISQLAKKHSFSEFVKKLAEEPSFIELDITLRPQISFLMDENSNLNIDFIGKVENFDNDIVDLSNLLGIYNKIKSLNSSITEVGKKNISKDTEKIIRNIYKEDFEVFYNDF